MIEILSEIGEVLCLGIGLLLVFTFLHSLSTIKSEMNLKPFVPVVGGFFGVCMGVFLGDFLSETWAIIGAVTFGILGIVMSLSMSNQAQDY